MNMSQNVNYYKDLTGQKLILEPGDATHYEILVITMEDNINEVVVVMTGPNTGAGLIALWRLREFYKEVMANGWQAVIDNRDYVEYLQSHGFKELSNYTTALMLMAVQHYINGNAPADSPEIVKALRS